MQRPFRWRRRGSGLGRGAIFEKGKYARPRSAHPRFAVIRQPVERRANSRIQRPGDRFTIVSGGRAWEVVDCDGWRITCQFRVAKNRCCINVNAGVGDQNHPLGRVTGGQVFSDPLGPGCLAADEHRDIGTELGAEFDQCGRLQTEAPDFVQGNKCGGGIGATATETRAHR